ncbi:YeiH family protein [Comamonas jiangduensis]|uniref:YeiH family protein n=1 Tax=Comamonas jiangduensis TaxID=1194168 RepID=UPI0028A934ED|nr:YeiH family protein [Comamonas jiangduensis]
MNTLSASSLAFQPWQWLRRTTPGLALSTAVALTAISLAQLAWFTQHGLGALTLAIVLGLLLGNTVYPRWAHATTPGVALSKQQLLRTGIVLYGLRLTFQDIGQVGWAGVALDALVLASTFGLACLLGLRVFGLDKRTTLLIGAGSSICGAAAVLATAPVAKGRTQDVAVAIATVVVFGTVGTFLYPALYQWNAAHGWLPMDAQQYGLYVGATVHEVAQVVAAGAAVSPEATNTAVIAKMVRVMMLAPFLLLLSAALARSLCQEGTAAGDAAGISIPWFALGFVAVAGIHSLGILPDAVVRMGVELDNLLLAIAMAALGLTTHWQAVRAAGIKPLLLAAILFAWLLGAGGLLTYWLG